MDSGKHSPPWLSSSLVYEYENSYGTKFDPRLFDTVDQPPPVHIIYPRPSPNKGRRIEMGLRGELVMLGMLFSIILVDR